MGDTPTASSLYNSAKVRADRLDRFADLRGDATGRVHADKAILTLHPRHRDRLITRFPARALLAVRIAGRSDTALRAAAPADLLRTLAPSTALQLRGADQRDLSFLAELARRLPGYVLEVGTDPTQIAPALAELLADA